MDGNTMCQGIPLEAGCRIPGIALTAGAARVYISSAVTLDRANTISAAQHEAYGYRMTDDRI